MKHDYVFSAVCQNGVFEVKALLLALSFKHHDQTNSSLIFGKPPGKLDPHTEETLEQLGTPIVDITTPIKDYPISNKLATLKAVCNSYPAKNHVFMDTDMLWIRPFNGVPHADNFDIHLRAGGEQSTTYYSSSEDWAPVYALFNLAPPTEKIRAFESEVLIPPYFNAGFICTNQGVQFSEDWLQACKVIDTAPSIKHKRPWLDQLAIPVVCAKNNFDIGILDHRFNAPNRFGIKYPDWSINHYSLLTALAQQKNMHPLLKRYIQKPRAFKRLLERLLKNEITTRNMMGNQPPRALGGENIAARLDKNIQELRSLKILVETILAN